MLPRLFHIGPLTVYSFGLMVIVGFLAGVALASRIHAYRRPHRAGQVLALYLGGYSVYRFLIEFLRKGVTAKVLAFGLTEAQVFSLFAIAAAAAWWAWLGRRSAPAPEPVRDL